MNLQIDTTNKIFRITEKVGMNELIEVLDKLMPRKEWGEYTLETNVTVNWTSPIVVNPWKQGPRPYDYPWYTQCGYDQLEGYQQTLNQGIYNVEIPNR